MQAASLPNLPTIYTIGHSNAPAGEVIRLLKHHGIQLLADVRSTPYSQYNLQFNRETWRTSLSSEGITYCYMGDTLGGRPPDPALYKDRQLPDAHGDYLHLVNYALVMQQDFFLRGIDELLMLAVGPQPVVIMCSEEDPARCHRHHLVGAYLTRSGRSMVLHIRADGSLVPDRQLPEVVEKPDITQLSLFGG